MRELACIIRRLTAVAYRKIPDAAGPRRVMTTQGILTRTVQNRHARRVSCQATDFLAKKVLARPSVFSTVTSQPLYRLRSSSSDTAPFDFPEAVIVWTRWTPPSIVALCSTRITRARSLCDRPSRADGFTMTAFSGSSDEGVQEARSPISA